MTLTRQFLAMLALACAPFAPAAWADPPLEVSSCGSIVPPHRRAVLTGDVACSLHCTADPSVACDPHDGCPLDPDDPCVGRAIQLGRGSVLRLNGHTLTGAYNRSAISCDATELGGTCTVVGPGSIESTKGSAISSLKMHIHARELTMNGSYGAIVTQGDVEVRHVAFGSWDSDVLNAKRIRVYSSTSLGHGGGFFAVESVSLAHVTLDASVHAGKSIKGHAVTLVGEGPCPLLDAPAVRVSDLVTQGCTP